MSREATGQFGICYEREAYDRQRPYHREYTGSRLITEVKHGWARLVLAWVTCWEYRVLLAFLSHIFH